MLARFAYGSPGKDQTMDVWKTGRWPLRLCVKVSSLSVLLVIATSGMTFAQEPLVTQEFDGPPHYRLICHQAGRVIEDQASLDHVLLYADSSGVLHRVDYARGSETWHTISIAAGTSCQVDPQQE
jgi:hypothetical protein